MKFGHYWPKDPARERIEHLRPVSPRESLLTYGTAVLPTKTLPISMPSEITAFHARQSRDERAAAIFKEETWEIHS
jgi:hypothetical protein